MCATPASPASTTAPTTAVSSAASAVAPFLSLLLHPSPHAKSARPAHVVFALDIAIPPCAAPIVNCRAAGTCTTLQRRASAPHNALRAAVGESHPFGLVDEG